MVNNNDFGVNPSNNTNFTNPLSSPKDKKHQKKAALEQTALLQMLQDTLSKTTALLASSNQSAPTQGSAPIESSTNPPEITEEDLTLALGTCAALLNQLQIDNAQAQEAQARNVTENDLANISLLSQTLEQNMTEARKNNAALLKHLSPHLSNSIYSVLSSMLDGALRSISWNIIFFNPEAKAQALQTVLQSMLKASPQLIKGIIEQQENQGFSAAKARFIADSVMTGIATALTLLKNGADPFVISENLADFALQVDTKLNKLINDSLEVVQLIKQIDKVEGSDISPLDRRKLDEVMIAIIQLVLGSLFSLAKSGRSHQINFPSPSSTASLQKTLKKLGQNIELSLINKQIDPSLSNQTRSVHKFVKSMIADYDRYAQTKAKQVINLLKSYHLSLQQNPSLASSKETLTTIQSSIILLELLAKYCPNLGPSASSSTTPSIDTLTSQTGINGQALYEAIKKAI